MKTVLRFIIMALSLVLSLLTLSACSDFGEYYDDDNAIIKKSSISRKMSTKSFEDGIYNESTREFNGIYTVCNIDASKQPTVHIELTINSGDFKVVAINTAKTLNGVELTASERITILTDKSINEDIALPSTGGMYTIKLVGRKADFEIKIETK